ncbi:MAG: M20/M25/M40 family metallo-hydrolase [Patescibacteria group bacterium]|nr:M20/M25/M40 family metallo-hydrolase [Patescibacteria group bacterium]
MTVVNGLTNIQQQVLGFLSNRPNEQFYLRKLAAALDVDPGNLSRLIQSLVKSGILNRQKIGNQVYFSVPNTLKTSEAPISNSLDYELIKQKLTEIEPDLIKLTQNLIRIPSVSGEHPEREIAEFILRFVRSYGLKAQEITKDVFRPNLIIDTDPDRKETFLLVGHMDTIGVGLISDWEHYPFSGHITGGRIIGRGAVDMKGGISCAIFTLILVKELDLKLPYNVRLVLVSNEEGGSTDTRIFDQGMEFLIKSKQIFGKAAIYGYGGSYNIGIGHRGVLRIRIKTQGENIHTGSVKWQKRERGVNAVTGMAEILLALEKMSLPKMNHPAFPTHENVITPGTMILHGGSAVSTVPGECTTVVEVRYLPGLDINSIYTQIKETCEKIVKRRVGLTVNLEKFVEIPPVALSSEEPVVEALKEACQEVYEKPISARGTGPANESFMLINMGIPTVVFGPLGSGAHAANEFVYSDSLTRTVEVYLRTIEKFLRLDY